MPKATASKEGKKFELKSCPGGFVNLRRFNYGEVLHRREIGGEMSGTPGKDEKGANKGLEKFDLKVHHVEIQTYEFSRAIVDHNLEDDTGKKLNLGTVEGIAQLDSTIAQEIEELINALNEPPGDEESKSLP